MMMPPRASPISHATVASCIPVYEYVSKQIFVTILIVRNNSDGSEILDIEGIRDKIIDR